SHGIAMRADGVRRDGMAMLALPAVGIATLTGLCPALQRFSPQVLSLLEIEAQYRVYLARQSDDIARLKEEEARRLPDGLDYTSIPGLSAELQAKLMAERPETVAQARRIEGMTPAALLLLLAAGEAARRKRAAG
ncbi:MAG: tRNA uridine-5-carboxymethylaminomethyl(34) synthesis enzyme MnmG, partial [Pseudomonadota bacterium]